MTKGTILPSMPALDSLRAFLARGEVVIPVVQGAAEARQFDLDCPRGRVEFRKARLAEGSLYRRP